MMKKGIALAIAAMMTVSMGCMAFGEENSSGISSVDDLPGKKIGVQMGTTGDIYASDYEGDEEGTSVERFSKGAQAVMALKQGKVDCVIIDSQPAIKFVEANDDLTILNDIIPVAHKERSCA